MAKIKTALLYRGQGEFFQAKPFVGHMEFHVGLSTSQSYFVFMERPPERYLFLVLFYQKTIPGAIYGGKRIGSWSCEKGKFMLPWL